MVVDSDHCYRSDAHTVRYFRGSFRLLTLIAFALHVPFCVYVHHRASVSEWGNVYDSVIASAWTRMSATYMRRASGCSLADRKWMPVLCNQLHLPTWHGAPTSNQVVGPFWHSPIWFLLVMCLRRNFRSIEKPSLTAILMNSNCTNHQPWSMTIIVGYDW